MPEIEEGHAIEKEARLGRPNICKQNFKLLANYCTTHVLGENPRNLVEGNIWKPGNTE